MGFLNLTLEVCTFDHDHLVLKDSCAIYYFVLQNLWLGLCFFFNLTLAKMHLTSGLLIDCYRTTEFKFQCNFKGKQLKNLCLGNLSISLLKTIHKFKMTGISLAQPLEQHCPIEFRQWFNCSIKVDHGVVHSFRILSDFI